MSEPGAEHLLLVNARDREEVRVVLAAGSSIEDLRWSRGGHESAVGNLYLGVVKQVETGLDAAFVDYGASRAGFLHLGNLHPGYAGGGSPFDVAGTATEAAAGAVEDDAGEGRPAGSIADYLQAEQLVLVQVLRDPVRGKGATLTTFLSLAGRLLVLMPSLGRIGVSRRIRDEEERERLRETVAAIEVPDGLGLIARTAAAKATKRDLRRDLRHLVTRWKAVGTGCQETAPCLLLAEESAAARAVRDLFSPEVSKVIVDDRETAREVEDFLHLYAPRSSVEVERYTKGQPLFEAYNVERDYQLLFRARVPVGEGASIVIHQTEALTAIDVNSGRVDQGSLERTACHANLLAAEEIARQIRLRDLGGIIVVDFIDMTVAENRKAVESAFGQALRRDRARLKPGRLGLFGLLPLTRRRQGTGLPNASEMACRSCGGTGSLIQNEAGALRILRRLRAAGGAGAWKLRANPGVLATLRELHGQALKDLGVRVEEVPDIQVPAGEPVLEGISGGR